MENEVTIIFPNQLFQDHPALSFERPVYLIEEWLFFRQFAFHAQKLLLHRASMKFYQNWLENKGYKVNYIDTTLEENDCRTLISLLAKRNTIAIHMAAASDDWLTKRIHRSCINHQISIHIYDNPNFLSTQQDMKDYFEQNHSYFQTHFYKWQRKKRNILMQADGEPVGGKWTFDNDNRKKFPKTEQVPDIHLPKENKYIKEARQYIQKLFPAAYGSIQTPVVFAVTFEDAEVCLDDFLLNRFQKFGIYEDAIVAKESVLHHSLLTPMLNIGLLQPQQILDKTLFAAEKYQIPLNSLEGFIRQIIGWREFIRIVYQREGSKIRTTNFWKHRRKIPKEFWTGETGIVPIDTTIRKIIKTGYCHHIERLMVLGNFMLLCEFDPDEVYRWFMEMFIDAYDWVMVPNVYSMSQFADGGLITTKPYISGSNYLQKMSDYEKGDWQEIWDGLFWRFMHIHRHFMSKNPRLGLLIKTFDNMPVEKQQLHLNNAEQFLLKLDSTI